MTSEKERSPGARPQGAECLEDRARQIAAEAALLRRHEELLSWAVEELGLERAFAEMVYEIAQEEEVEPAYAFEFVRCRVGIGGEAKGSADAPSLQSTPPDWLEASPSPDEALREWRLRTSIRRLRTLLREQDTPAEALRAFAVAPDLEDADYGAR